MRQHNRAVFKKQHPHGGGLRGLGGISYPKDAREVREYEVPAPVIDPHGGVVPPAGCRVVITQGIDDSESGSAIFYTLDGTKPTIRSNLYEGPITVLPPTIPQLCVKAIAAKAVNCCSEPASEVFSFKSSEATPPPNISCDGDVIEILAHPRATIYFSTVLGSDPLDGYLYTGPFSLLSHSAKTFVITAVAIIPGMVPSERISLKIDINASTVETPRRRTSSPKHVRTSTGGDVEPQSSIELSYNNSPPALIVTIQPDPHCDCQYSRDKNSWIPIPASGQLTIPLESYEMFYVFKTTSPNGKFSFSYLFIPPKPRWEADLNQNFSLDTAIKWLWEVHHQLPLLKTEFLKYRYCKSTLDVANALSKMESAVLMVLFHLSAEKIVYEGIEPVPGQENATPTDRHFNEPADALLSLYHALIDAQKGGPGSGGEVIVLNCLKKAVRLTKELLQLLPDRPAGVTVPKWLQNIKDLYTNKICKSDDPQIVECCEEAVKGCRSDNELPEYADATGGLVGLLLKKLSQSEEEKDKLKADLSQASVTCDELQNQIDIQLAWRNGARIREAKLEARIEELRRSQSLGGPTLNTSVTEVTPIVSSHLAFQINPD